MGVRRSTNCSSTVMASARRVSSDASITANIDVVSFPFTRNISFADNSEIFIKDLQFMVYFKSNK